VNLPNTITLGRLVSTAACIVLLETVADPVNADPTLIWWALAIFVISAATDFVDGWLARRFGQVTAFGRVADPFVDKILICGVLISLLRFPAATQYLTNWMVSVIVAREFLVTAVRGLAEAAGLAFGADWIGKLKMVAQCVTAGALLTLVAGSTMWAWLANAGVWISLVLTIWSGVHYVWKARALLRTS
jgi:CDP-diacylglycerol--glycerol-3-phosphate 3-phosphatidyltransferase